MKPLRIKFYFTNGRKVEALLTEKIFHCLTIRNKEAYPSLRKYKLIMNKIEKRPEYVKDIFKMIHNHNYILQKTDLIDIPYRIKFLRSLC